jgi:hypothetical protein
MENQTEEICRIDLHFVSLAGSLTPQCQQHLASGGLSDWQLLFVHRTESEPSVPWGLKIVWAISDLTFALPLI